ncbi:MAG: putative redox-active protein (C_GCAxxG_C_C) [Pelotomaculum sp. PtaB.Bin104]|nr:MAG: putative redox-active protein (C_GCAxxG_C_C) [Pelotomaculum sp. PtaB.Bin104]
MIDANKDILLAVRNKAETYFNEGYNCAQAVALSNVEMLKGQTDGIRQVAAGFGHGMNAGCTCGALAGGVTAVSLMMAGPTTMGFDKEISAAAAELHQMFVKNFGLTCCRSLRRKLSPFKNSRCKEITVTTAALTMELILARKTPELASVGVHLL